jgi:hypothetical protein
MKVGNRALLGILGIGFFILSNQVLALTSSEIEDIKQKIISDSISSYKGSCPCPYSKMKGGKSCGKFSAYSKKGAKKPICYAVDVSEAMVQNYKK